MNSVPFHVHSPPFVALIDNCDEEGLSGWLDRANSFFVDVLDVTFGPVNSDAFKKWFCEEVGPSVALASWLGDFEQKIMQRFKSRSDLIESLQQSSVQARSTEEASFHTQFQCYMLNTPDADHHVFTRYAKEWDQCVSLCLICA
jgi:hypothetical protein